MAIQCKYCGTELSKDDARFCNNCGMLVPSHPFSPESLSAMKSGSKIPFTSYAEDPAVRAKQEEPAKSEVLPEASNADEPSLADFEKIALDRLSKQADASKEAAQEKLPETPRPGPPKRAAASPSGVAYKQISPLTSRQIPGMKRKMPGAVQMSPVAPAAWPEPVTHVSMKESAVPEKEDLEEQKEASSVPARAQSKAAPVREFHVAVWQDEEMRELSHEEERAIEDLPTRAVVVPPVQDMPKQAVDTPVEDVPTQAVDVSVADMPTRAVDTSFEDMSTQVEDVSVEDMPTRTIDTHGKETPTQLVDTPVDDLPTQLLAVPAESRAAVQEPVIEKTPRPFPAVPPVQTVMQERSAKDWRGRSNDVYRSSNPASAPVQPNVSAPWVSSADYPPVNAPAGGMLMSQDKEMAVSSPSIRKSRKRWPIVVVLLLLVVLAVGGVGAVMVLSPQSAADPMLQPQLSFSDTQLGISLLYPNGWVKQIEAAKSTVHFYTNDHVGQVDVIVTSGGGDVKQALQQEATKMGMSSTKTGVALEFGGARWQQLQGTMQISGASYTDTLLATSQGGKLFMIVQQAPQNNYADWDKTFFAPLRASLKFL